MSFDMPPALPAKLKGADGVPGLKKGLRGKAALVQDATGSSGDGDGTQKQTKSKVGKVNDGECYGSIASPYRTARKSGSDTDG